MGTKQNPRAANGNRASDSVLPWLRTNATWLAPLAVIAGTLAAVWFKIDFSTSVINPESMLKFREQSVKRECRAGMAECFAAPNASLMELWRCLDGRVGK